MVYSHKIGRFQLYNFDVYQIYDRCLHIVDKDNLKIIPLHSPYILIQFLL